MSDLLRSGAECVANVLTAPLLAVWHAKLVRFTTVSHQLSLISGSAGVLLRRSWYERGLASCGRSLVVDFGAAIRTPKTRIGNDCYIGVGNWIGWVDIGDDFLSGSHVVILSGRNQHGFDRLDTPMRLQRGGLERITVGEDVWVGTHATISADVAPHTVVASGAVVTKTFEPYDILGGVPAKRIGSRCDPKPQPLS